MAKSITSLAVGDKIKLGVCNGEVCVWQIAEKDTASLGKINYRFDTPTTPFYYLLSAKIVARAALHTTSQGVSDETVWTLSAMRQWLNSNADSGQWFSPAFAAQVPPSYFNWAGFLRMFTANELSVMLVDGIGDRVVLPWFKTTNVTHTAKQGNEVIFSAESVNYDAPDAAAVLTNSKSKAERYENSMARGYIESASGSYRYGLTYAAVRKCRIGSSTDDSEERDAYGIRPVCMISTAARVSDNVDADGCYTLVFNNPPPAPGNINVPATVKGGHGNLISWGRSVDPDGDAVGYKLERQINGGDWTQIYNGALLTYTDDGIEYGTEGTVKWRVRAYDIYGDESGNTVSASRTIINNRPPVISGEDGDLGTFGESALSFDYVITDADNDPVDVVVKLDGVTIQDFAATLGETNTVSFSADAWRRILDGVHTIVITATDGTESATRTKTFTKNVRRVIFESAAFETEGDEAPLRVSLSAAMSIPAGASAFIYVANNGADEAPTWEDCTAEVRADAVYTFTNETKTAESWAIKVRAKLYDFTATLDGVNFVPTNGFIANVLEYLGGESGEITISDGNITVGGESAGTAAEWGVDDVDDGTYDVIVTKAIAPVYIASIQGATNDTTA